MAFNFNLPGEVFFLYYLKKGYKFYAMHDIANVIHYFFISIIKYFISLMKAAKFNSIDKFIKNSTHIESLKKWLFYIEVSKIFHDKLNRISLA